MLYGNRCICIPGYAFDDRNICKLCPPGSQASTDQTRCVCSQNQVFVPSNFTCSPCPSFSSPNIDQSSCVCNLGYHNVSGKCVQIVCSSN